MLLVTNPAWTNYAEIQLWWVFAAIMILIGSIRTYRAKRYM